MDLHFISPHPSNSKAPPCPDPSFNSFPTDALIPSHPLLPIPLLVSFLITSIVAKLTLKHF